LSTVHERQIAGARGGSYICRRRFALENTLTDDVQRWKRPAAQGRTTAAGLIVRKQQIRTFTPRPSISDPTYSTLCHTIKLLLQAAWPIKTYPKNIPYPKKGKGKGSPNSLTERRVPRLIPVLGSQPACDVSHKSDGRLPLLSARPAVTPAGCYQFCCFVNRGTMGVNSLPKTVSRQSRDCDLNLGLSAPEFSTLTTRLPSHPVSHPPQPLKPKP